MSAKDRDCPCCGACLLVTLAEWPYQMCPECLTDADDAAELREAA